MSTSSACLRLLVLTACTGMLAAPGAKGQCLSWSHEFDQTPFGQAVQALATHDDGSGRALYAGSLSNLVARWNGSTWSLVGPDFDDDVYALTTCDLGSGLELFVGGAFRLAGATQVNRVARWDGSLWQPLGTGIFLSGGNPGVGTVFCFATFDDGTGAALYVGGYFSGAGQIVSRGIVKWDGAGWHGVGGGVNNPTTFYTVTSMVVHDDGSGPALYLSGGFTSAGGQPFNHIVRWNGTNWSAVGAGLDGLSSNILVFDDGLGPKLYGVGYEHFPAGPYGLLCWDGANWSSLGGTIGSTVTSLCAFDDGTGAAIYAAGAAGTWGGTSANMIAKWDGTSWSALGDGINADLSSTHQVEELHVHDQHDGQGPALFAGGTFLWAGDLRSRKVAAWYGCHEPLELFCRGDGTLADCPCDNRGAFEHGCGHSEHPSGASLVASGTPAQDDVVLHLASAPPAVLAVHLQGDALVSGSAPFGDGLRCLAGNLLRLYVSQTAADGSASAPQALQPSIRSASAALGDPLAPGSLRYYQAWYRDPDPEFCPPPAGSTWNASNGVRLVW